MADENNIRPPAASSTPPSNIPTGRPPLPGSQAPGDFRSSIRTMAGDISSINKGQPLSGSSFDIKRQVQPSSQSAISKPPIRPMAPSSLPPLPVMPPPRPSSPIPPASIPKPSPIAPPEGPSFSPTPPSLPASVPSAPINITQGGSFFSLRNMVIIIIVLLFVGFGAWFFLFRSSQPEVVLTPTPNSTQVVTAEPTPPITLEDFFSSKSLATVNTGSGFLTRLNSAINSQTVEAGPAVLLRLSKGQDLGNYAFSDFLTNLGINPLPTNIAGNLDDSEFFLTLLRKTDGKISRGFIVKVSQATALSGGLNGWEANLTKNMAGFFAIVTSKATSASFLDNSYQGFSVRYRNFPDANSTVDYSVLGASNGQQYLLFANSREHIYSLMDSLLGSPVVSSSPSPLPSETPSTTP